MRHGHYSSPPRITRVTRHDGRLGERHARARDEPSDETTPGTRPGRARDEPAHVTRTRKRQSHGRGRLSCPHAAEEGSALRIRRPHTGQTLRVSSALETSVEGTMSPRQKRTINTPTTAATTNRTDCPAPVPSCGDLPRDGDSHQVVVRRADVPRPDPRRADSRQSVAREAAVCHRRVSAFPTA